MFPMTLLQGVSGIPGLQCLVPTRAQIIVHRGSTPSHTSRHSSTTMAAAEQSGFYRLKHIALKIRTLLSSLPQQPLGYDEITPKIGFWIEYVLREQFTTVDELVEGVSSVAWEHCISYESVACFLKEFRDEPHRSEQARSFVDKLCEHILRWFTIVSVEDLSPAEYSELIGEYKEGTYFIGAASLVGHLIERDLFSHELVRRHLIKSLTAHHYTDRDGLAKSVRAMAIYQLFVAARNPLLQGLLEPEDVQACFKALDAKISPKVPGPDAAKLNVRCPLSAGASCQLPFANS